MSAMSTGADAGTRLQDVGRREELAIGTLAAHVARRIEAEVIRRGWPVGESLGSEPELRERHGVSRSVLREAVRLVEHHEVARMRRGPNGGLFVMAPDAGPAARAMVIYLEYVGTSVDDLMQARRLLEPLAAGLAARSVTEEGIELVRGAAEADLGADDSEPEALHVILGELSGNPVLQLFIDVLIRLTVRFSAPEGPRPLEHSRSRKEAARQHAAIADAVISGEAGRAETQMAAYLTGVSAWMRKHARAAGTVRLPPLDMAADEPHVKLAEVVARRMREEIVISGWPAGAVIGSEADLLTRYGISRAVLREAVRLLEYHSVARMRRGPGGGLVVGTPDPQASIDTMALYLEYREVSGADLIAVREAIELGIVTRVVERHDVPGVPEMLEAAGRWISEGRDDDQDKADHYHEVLADLAGNPVLALYMRILTELWRRHTGRERNEVEPETRTEIVHVHRRITEAVLAGDGGLARNRMRRHLAALESWWH